MNIISIVNLKGGVGKTTSCLNIGAGLAKKGKRVLLIDLDPQGNLSEYLDWQPEGKPTVSELLYSAVAGLPLQAEEGIRHGKENIDFLPSTKMLAAMVSVIGNDSNSQEVLKRILSQPAFSCYEYILIDCKPSLDLLVGNALTASNGVIIPVQAELFAYNAIQEVLDTVNRIQNTANPNLKADGILLTFFRKQTALSKEVLEALQESYPQLLLKTPISFSTEAGRSVCERRSLVSQESNKLGKEYMEIVEELLEGWKWEH